MSLRAHRPAPPPPSGGRQQPRKNNLNSGRSNNVSKDSNNNRQNTVFSWPTVIRPSAASTTGTTAISNTNINSKLGKKKPPPRPAPPKNYQASRKASDTLTSPPPDLLADLADIFSAPTPKSGQPKSQPFSWSTSQHASSVGSSFRNINQNPRSSFTFGQTSSQQQQSVSSSFPFRPAKKYPAPVPSANKTNSEMSLIDFDTPIGTAHMTPSNTMALASAVNRHKSLLDLDMQEPPKPLVKPSGQPAFDLLSSRGSQLSCPVPALSAQNAARVLNSPASGYVQQQAVSFGSQHRDTIINWGVRSVQEQVAAREFSPPEPKFPPPPPPPQVEEEEEWNHAPVLEVCTAQYDFNAESPGDLSLHTGDRVEVEAKQSKDWWTGRCNGQRGIFPSNFVKCETSVFPVQQAPGDKLDSSSGCFVKALYTFTAEQPTDLDFQEGDTVQVLYRINQDWLFGSCHGKEGQFPAGFVSKISGLASSQEVCCAIYAFQGENGDELSFREGDRIVIVEKGSGDWWKGKLESDPSGKAGLFPATFVELCS